MILNSIKNIDLRNKRVFLRVDYNVSLNSDNSISDDTRITQTLPTIKHLLNKGAGLILASHLGRPGGKVDKKYSMNVVATRLSEYLGKKVRVIPDYWKGKIIVNSGEVVMLENLRFNSGEEGNDPKLAEYISRFADIYVNDAFGSSHRAHMSIVGIARHLPSYAGLLLEKEITLIDKLLNKRKGSLTVVIGGAKTPEKIGVIDNLLSKADTLLLGGAVANTFLATWGIKTGVSLVDHEMIEMARQIMWKATQSSAKLILPEDVVVSNTKQTREPVEVSYKKVPGHLAIYDIGRGARTKYTDEILSSDYVIWNGPMGLFEKPQFAAGTKCVMEAMVKCNGTTVIGGGDTLTALQDKEQLDHITHISTGGGALLEYLEKESLPGIDIIKKHK